jgi:flagellar hook protein FlgE
MSINRSLYIGLSGMNANTQALNVVGDNIANMNTVGYKSGRSIFQEMLGQSMMGTAGTSMVGSGVSLAAISKNFNQGSLLGTGGEWDLAIGGDGFFALSGTVDGQDGTYYSRAGQFYKGPEGHILNPMGLKLMGYPANGAGEIGSNLSELMIDDSPIPPTPTADAMLQVNLDDTTTVSTEAFDPTKPGETSDYQTSMSIYDATGSSYQVDVYYKKTGEGQWEYHVLTDGGNVEGGTEGENAVLTPATNTLTFDDAGILTTNPANFTLSFQPVGASAIQEINVDMAGSSQWAEESVLKDLDVDGSQSGTFQYVNIDKDGTVIGTFSNGEERTLGQVALARFKSNSGLTPMDGGIYDETSKSGNVIMGKPNSGGRGALMAGNLEQSNVDLATEFANMIIAQRGYQANSRSITTADQVIQDALQLKR